MNCNPDIHINLNNTVFNVLFIKKELFTHSIPKHSHGKFSYEIHFISDGKGTLLVNNTDYSLLPNSLFITGPNVEHQQTPDLDNPMTEWCVYLKVDSTSSTDEIVHTFCNIHFWIGSDSQDIPLIFKQIEKELSCQYIGYRTNTEALLRQLIIAMVRNYKNINSHYDDKIFSSIDNRRVLIIEEYFLYNYTNLSLVELSNILGLSIRQTERVLLNYYGKTFNEKKLEARMSAAIILLNNKAKSINDIAMELGYSSASHFCISFKQYYNISPSSYRKKLFL